LKAQISFLEEQGQLGKRYRASVEQEVLRLSGMVQPEVPRSVMVHLTEKATMEDLEQLSRSYRKKAETMMPMRPQLWTQAAEEQKAANNAPFQI
jgi:hypothetical protein